MSERRMATAMNMAVRQRNYRRARDRALARLAQAYPELYKEYLLEEQVSDERMGKKWLDITGSTTTGKFDTRTEGSYVIPPTHNDSKNQGNNGGEA